MFLETIGPNSLYDLKAFRDFVCVKMKSLCIEISLQNKAGQKIDEYIPPVAQAPIFIFLHDQLFATFARTNEAQVWAE